MDKRYQVFISSTYADLKDERRAVYQTLMEMDCIPAGMELFPATDEEQWLFIQKIIDDSDYYVLILGGRYGSVTADGVSYTEKEFDYAVSKGVKVVALIHGEPGKLPVEKSEMDPAVRERLEAFRNKAATGRLVKFWTSADQIPGLAATSLLKTMKTFPAVGWVRADKMTGSTELLAQLNELRILNDRLTIEINEIKSSRHEFPSDIASGSDLFNMNIDNTNYQFESYMEKDSNHKWVTRERKKEILKKLTLTITWDDIFLMVSSEIMAPLNDSDLYSRLCSKINKKFSFNGVIKIFIDDYMTIKNQLFVLGLIVNCQLNDRRGRPESAWELTDVGRAYLSKLLLVRKPSVEASEADMQDQN